jgi:23S rRNA (guanosine2251-2'-O)-methyltransferase
VYGKNAVSELLSDKPRDVSEIVLVDFAKESHKDKADFAEIIKKAKLAKIPTRYISKKESVLLVWEVRTQRVLAKIKGFKYLQFSDWKDSIKNLSDASRLVLVLDKIEDPQNFGAIVRSAGAAGVSAVFVANASQAPVTATVFKTSAGVITKVPIVQVANISDTLEKLKDMDFWTYGVSMDDGDEEDQYDTGSKSIWEQEFDKNTVLVVGAEGAGLSRIAKEKCDFLVHIPMENNIESLNVSVAAALTMYEWRRQQS